jgi:argininosuccinate lyase
MQEDKEGVFDAADALGVALAATTGMIRDMTPQPDAMRAALKVGFPTATDLADYLVRELGMSFRKAHHLSGTIVAAAAAKGLGLEDMSLDAFRAIEPQIKPDINGLLSVASSAAARTSFGGTAPDEVRARIADARQRFAIG